MSVWFLGRSSHHEVFIVVIVWSAKRCDRHQERKKEIKSPKALCPALSTEELYNTEWLLYPFQFHCIAFINRMCFSINSIKAIYCIGLCEVGLRESGGERDSVPPADWASS